MYDIFAFKLNFENEITCVVQQFEAVPIFHNLHV